MNVIRKKQEQVEKDRRKAEREAKAAKSQLAKDVATANKPAKKAPSKKQASTTKKAKNAALIVPIRQKLSPLLRPGARKPRSEVLIVPPKQVGAQGVAVATTSSRTINLPQRFR